MSSMKIQRVHRDDNLIAKLEQDVTEFLAEVDSKTQRLMKLAEAAYSNVGNTYDQGR